jgi:AcrR family transcriptional regulator
MSRSAPTNGSAPPEPSGRPPRSEGARRRELLARNLHERIEAAAVHVIAAQGYEASKVQNICSDAEISEEVFYEHFKDKQEAAMSALETSVDQVMLDLREIFSVTASWPEGIWQAIDAVLEWMVNEPAFARLAFVEMLAAGQAGLDLLQSLMDAFAMFLEPGYKLAPEKAPSKRLVDETVANAIFGLLNEHIVREGSTENVRGLLPEMVRRILTPFLGAEQAAAFVAQRSAQE